MKIGTKIRYTTYIDRTSMPESVEGEITKVARKPSRTKLGRFHVYTKLGYGIVIDMDSLAGYTSKELEVIG